MGRFRSVILSALCVMCGALAPSVTFAIGWGPTDFLVFGAPNFPDRIGVFDQNFGFKGYLFTGWTGLQAMNFDQQGRLVTYNFFTNEVRVYDSGGTLVGGFNSVTSPMLTGSGDVQVMPDGNYAFGTAANGVRVFTPQGTYVRQFGSGNCASIALLPANRLWAGINGTGDLTVNVFDTVSGSQVGSFNLDQQTRPAHMEYGPQSGTVLCIDRDRDAGGVFERDLTGALLRTYHIPLAQTTCNGATYGPGGDIFGTSSNDTIGIVEWRPDASVVRTIASNAPARILWAGNSPEPSSMLIGVSACALLLRRHRNWGKTTGTEDRVRFDSQYVIKGRAEAAKLRT